MSNEPISARAAMEGRGAYNRHAWQPAKAATLALPLLERAVQSITFDSTDRPIVIADYGSSEGKNSLAPITLTIDSLRKRVGRDRPILVYHIDRPSNDFNSLFELLDIDADSYGRCDQQVFPCAIGRSFYGSVLPRNSVDLAWSSYAAMWISKIPAAIPNHFFVFASQGSVRAEFERQGTRDWKTFLSLRAAELRPGGRLVVVVPGVHDDGTTGFEAIMDHANSVLVEMVSEGALTADERARMVLGVWSRHQRELISPFEGHGQFNNLTLEHADRSLLTDSWWDDYERDRDCESLATKQALFFRAVFAPTLASALTRVRQGDIEAFRAFADRLETGLRSHLAAEPAPLHSVVETIVVAKQGCA